MRGFASTGTRTVLPHYLCVLAGANCCYPVQHPKLTSLLQNYLVRFLPAVLPPLLTAVLSPPHLPCCSLLARNNLSYAPGLGRHCEIGQNADSLTWIELCMSSQSLPSNETVHRTLFGLGRGHTAVGVHRHSRTKGGGAGGIRRIRPVSARIFCICIWLRRR